MDHLRQAWANRIAMPVKDFKGRDRNMSKRQVEQACVRIVKDMARQLGYDGPLPEIWFGELSGATARFLDAASLKLAPTPGGAIVLDEEFWLTRAMDKELGYNEFGIVAHEAIHALVQGNEPSYQGHSQMFTEGGAEILRVAYWAQHAPPMDDRDAVRRDGKWTSPGAATLVAGINYREWVEEFMLRLASKVGWDKDRILSECKRVVAGNGNVKLDFFRDTNPNFAPPPGRKADAESLLLWLIEGYERKL